MVPECLQIIDPSCIWKYRNRYVNTDVQNGTQLKQKLIIETM